MRTTSKKDSCDLHKFKNSLKKERGLVPSLKGSTKLVYFDNHKSPSYKATCSLSFEKKLSIHNNVKSCSY